MASRRWLLIVAGVALLAGCSNRTTGLPVTPTPTLVAAATTAAASSPLPPETASTPRAPSVTLRPGGITPSEPSWSFSGSSSKKTAAFSVEGTLRIAYAVSSQANFIVDLDSPDGTTATSVANLTGSAKVSTWVYGASGPVYLDVTAGGPWRITVTEAEPGSSSPPQQFSGATDVTTVPVTFIGGETLTWSFKGDGNLTVDLIDPSDGTLVDNVVDTIGRGSDTAPITDAGEYALDVTANGAWSIAIAP